MLPTVVRATVAEHLRGLLDQDQRWVGRARWRRWLAHGDPSDTVLISGMNHDERLAAIVWLRQQRHVLFDALEHAGQPAPDGWVESLPLYRGLTA